MAKFRKYKPKPIKEPYVSKKKDRRQKRIKRHEAKSKVKALTSQIHLEPIPRNQTVENATKLNKALEFASDKFGNRNDYSKYLIPLLKTLDPRFDMKKPKPGDYNGFKITDDYDGKPNNLFKYVSFSDIPDNNPDIDSFTQSLLDLDWSSPENYQKHLDELNSAIKKTDINSLGAQFDISFFLTLESVMSSSAVWAIASKDLDPSEDRKLIDERIDTLYKTATNALQQSDRSIFNKFAQMIFNYEDFDIIVDTIDEMIYEAVKG